MLPWSAAHKIWELSYEKLELSDENKLTKHPLNILKTKMQIATSKFN